MSRFDISRFKQLPDDEFLCGICKNVLDDPKESPCRHVFCKVCITRALQVKSKCPICRKSFRERHLKDVLPLVQNLLNKLQMECEHVDNGCRVPISLEVYISHIANCDYMMVSCKNELCDEKFLKRDSEKHECQYRTFVCDEGCGCEVLISDRDVHNCVETLLRKYKDARERIEKLEERVKEMEANALDTRRTSGTSPTNLSDIISIGSSSFRDYNLSLSSDNLSNSDRTFDMRSPSISLSLGSSDNNNDDDDDDDDDDLGGWPFSNRRRPSSPRNSDTNENNNDNNSIRGDAEEAELSPIDADILESLDPFYNHHNSHVADHPTHSIGDTHSAPNSPLNSAVSACTSFPPMPTASSDTYSHSNNNNNTVDSDDNMEHSAAVRFPSVFGTYSSDESWEGLNSSRDRDEGDARNGGNSGGTGREGQSSRRKRTGSRNNHLVAKRARHHEGEQSTSAAGMEMNNGDDDINNGDDDVNNVNDGVNVSNPIPARRSARLRNLPATPVDDPDDLQVPATTSLLLQLYSNEDSSSSDDSWTPPV